MKFILFFSFYVFCSVVPLSIYANDNTETITQTCDAKYAKTQIFVFVSFSMPKESLEQWLQQAYKANAAVVIRGLANNSFKDTTYKVGELVSNTKDNVGGIQLDPTLYKQFNITKVPAVVVTNNFNCPSGTTCPSAFDVIYGDVTLDYALSEIAKSDSDFSEIASAALVKLRGKS